MKLVGKESWPLERMRCLPRGLFVIQGNWEKTENCWFYVQRSLPSSVSRACSCESLFGYKSKRYVVVGAVAPADCEIAVPAMVYTWAVFHEEFYDLISRVDGCGVIHIFTDNCCTCPGKWCVRLKLPAVNVGGWSSCPYGTHRRTAVGSSPSSQCGGSR